MCKKIFALLLISVMLTAAMFCSAADVTAADVTTNVASFAELNAALTDSTTTIVNVTQSFDVTDWLHIKDGITDPANAVSKTIQGNGFTLTMKSAKYHSIYVYAYTTLTLKNITLDFGNYLADRPYQGIAVNKNGTLNLFEGTCLKNWINNSDEYAAVRVFGTGKVLLGSCSFLNCTKPIYAAGSEKNGEAIIQCSVSSINSPKTFTSGVSGTGYGIRLGEYASCDFTIGNWSFDNFQYAVSSASHNGLNISTKATTTGFNVTNCKYGLYHTNASDLCVSVNDAAAKGVSISASEYGIYSSAGAVRINSTQPVSISGGICGVHAAQNVYITDSANTSVTGTANEGGKGNGIHTNQNVEISNSTVTVTAGIFGNGIIAQYDTALSGTSEGYVKMLNSNVTVNAGYIGVEVRGAFTLSGSMASLTGGNGGFGIKCDSSVTVSNCTQAVVINGGYHGIYAAGNISVANAADITVTGTFVEAGKGNGIYTYRDVEISGSNIKVNAAVYGNGITTVKDTSLSATTTGYVKITGSVISINAQNIGICARGNVQLIRCLGASTGGRGGYGIKSDFNVYITDTSATIYGGAYGIRAGGFVRISSPNVPSAVSVSIYNTANSVTPGPAISAGNVIAADSKTCLKITSAVSAKTNSEIVSTDGRAVTLRVYENVSDGTGRNAVSVSEPELGISYSGGGLADGDKNIYMYGTAYNSPLVYRLGSTLKTVQKTVNGALTGVVSSVPLGTTAQQLLANFANPNTVQIIKNGAAVNGAVSTGAVIQSLDGTNVTDSLEIAVTGDTDGNGMITASDYLRIKRAVLQSNALSLSGSMLVSADIDGDDNVTANDYIALKAYFKGKYQLGSGFTNANIDTTETYNAHVPRFANGKEYTYTLSNLVGNNFGQAHYITQQASATDGEYFYSFMINDKTTVLDSAYIYKIRISDWQTVKVSEMLILDHANGATYNSRTNRLVVVCSHTEWDDETRTTWHDFYTKVVVINPDTLEIEYEKKLYLADGKTYLFGVGIGYSATRDQYVFSKAPANNSVPDDEYVILDNNFNFVKLYHHGQLAGANSYLRQDLDADEDYIYFIQSYTDYTTYPNKLIVCDWDGNYVRTITVPDIPNSFRTIMEAESMFHIGNDYYLVHHYGGAYVYKLQMTPIN